MYDDKARSRVAAWAEARQKKASVPVELVPSPNLHKNGFIHINYNCWIH